ncbi:molybdenum cofactor guanylyltransferase [Candidatus Riflebacteria bacterium]
MHRLENFLIIGSAGRNSGKTELACRLINKFKVHKDITAVKITTVEKADGTCPRGGSGCGVCSSLDKEFLITRETSGEPGKDTSRLLEAGAKKVFWLRVLKSSLKKGLAALLDTVGKNSLCICESNSSRLHIEPGIFLVVKEKKIEKIKASCSRVLHFADRIIEFDFEKGKLDIALDDIYLLKNRWILRLNASAIILVGGKSRRMGRDKSNLTVAGKTMLEHIYQNLKPFFSEVLIGVRANGKSAIIPGTISVRDEMPGRGPLMGILSCLKASENELNFVIACDIPEIDYGLLMKLFRDTTGFDAVVPMTENKEYEPLFGLYHKRIIPKIEEVLKKGERKVTRIFPELRVKFIPIREEDSLTNLNTPEEFNRFLQRTKL